MKIKYLLSGRLLSDISHCRRLVDSWPSNIPFPKVVEDIKNIDDNDIIITKGYLGHSANLIRNHNPQNVFILDNSIFPAKGISNFRILNGNLDSLIKKENDNIYNEYYSQKVFELFEKSKKGWANDVIFASKEKTNKKKIILSFPWSIPLKNLIYYKNKNELISFKNKMIQLKKSSNSKIYEYKKQGAINLISNNDIPFYRTYKKNKKLENYLQICEHIVSPSSSLALMGLINKVNIILSRYNPYSNFLIHNPDFKKYDDQKLIKLLSSYISRLNFSINDLYYYLEESF